MAQHDFNIANAGGATVRADINNVLAAIQSSNSGTGAPSSTVAGMLWLDTSGGLPYALKIRDGGNNHWLTIGTVNDPGSDGNMSVGAIEGTAVLSTGESGGTKFLREDGDGTCSFQESGKVLQVLSANYTGSTTTTAIETFPTDLQQQITIGSGSKVLIIVQIGSIGATTTYTTFGYLRRDSTNINKGDSAGSRIQCTNFQRQESSAAGNTMAMTFLDNPGAGTYTYKVGFGVQSGGTARLNSSYDDGNGAYQGRAASTITVMEIGQ
jgi:hypothetical protein